MVASLIEGGRRIAGETVLERARRAQPTVTFCP